MWADLLCAVYHICNFLILTPLLGWIGRPMQRMVVQQYFILLSDNEQTIYSFVCVSRISPEPRNSKSHSVRLYLSPCCN